MKILRMRIRTKSRRGARTVDEYRQEGRKTRNLDPKKCEASSLH